MWHVVLLLYKFDCKEEGKLIVTHGTRYCNPTIFANTTQHRTPNTGSEFRDLVSISWSLPGLLCFILFAVGYYGSYKLQISRTCINIYFVLFIYDSKKQCMYWRINNIPRLFRVFLNLKLVDGALQCLPVDLPPLRMSRCNEDTTKMADMETLVFDSSREHG